MKTHSNSLVYANDEHCALGVDPRLDVVIVYDDLPAGRRAMHTLNRVMHQLDEGIQLRPLIWRFEHLEDPDWRAAATADADRVGLVIVSTSRKGDLPPVVQKWALEHLHPGPGAAGGLVTLFGPEDDVGKADSTSTWFLKDALEAAGLGFVGAAALPQASVTRAESNPAASLPERPLLSYQKILLVDDDDAICRVSAQVLRRAGYQVDAVADGEAGWEALQSSRYDLLVTDNQMPGLSGIELLKRLRSAHPSLPVILISGGMSEDMLAQAQTLRPATLLTKPFSPGELLAKVAELLSVHVAYHTEVAFPVSVKFCDHWGINE